MNVLLIAHFTFREAARKRVLLGIVVLTLAFLAIYALGSYFAFREMQQAPRLPALIKERATSQVLLAGLYVTNFAAGLLAIFTSVGAIASEVEGGTLQAIVPKPLRRRDILLGKWLGHAVMLTTYVLCTAGAVMVTVYSLARYLPPRPVEAVGLLVLGTLLLLSMSILGSTLLSTVTNGIVVFMLYALATAAGMVEQLGMLLENQTMKNIGVATSLVVPSDAVWKLASSMLQPAISSIMEIMGPFAIISPPSTWMAVYAAFYSLLAVLVGVVVFDRKDL